MQPSSASRCTVRRLAAFLPALCAVTRAGAGEAAPSLRGAAAAVNSVANATLDGVPSNASIPVEIGTAIAGGPANVPAIEGSVGVAGDWMLSSRSQPDAPSRSQPDAPADADVSPKALALPIFWWNVHWQCSLAAQGCRGTCKARAGQRFVQLAVAAGAQVVASIELSNGMAEPMSLPALGLAGWTQVDGPCSKGAGGDAAALAFAPGWQVLSKGGGCLRHDADARAFAVARVVPPVAVQGCPSLCVLVIHAPHTSITIGREVVSTVCGETLRQCAVAMGDWNAPAAEIGNLWTSLIGGAGPGLTAPDERTCCFPESTHFGVYDHLASNIRGGQYAQYTVHPYQLLEDNPVEQHRPVSARLYLPIA